jgi:hypothetical protein
MTLLVKVIYPLESSWSRDWYMERILLQLVVAFALYVWNLLFQLFVFLFLI